MVVAGAVVGAITARVFWASSALLGNVRKAAKRLRGVRDPKFDGPFDCRQWGASESASAGKLLAGTALKEHVPFHPVPDCRAPKCFEFE
jgi:hypothetical protein